MRILKVLCVLFGLMTISCGGAQRLNKHHIAHNMMVTRRIYVDKSFNDAELYIVKKAFATIEHDTRGIITYDAIYGFDFNQEIVGEIEPQYMHKIVLKKANSKELVIKMIDREINKSIKKNNPDHQMNAYILGYDMQRNDLEIIFIVADRLIKDKELYLSTVIHENLHSLNMKHYNDHLSIMNTSYEQFIEVVSGVSRRPIVRLTKADAIQFCSIYMCDAGDLNYGK